jgi:hypothetical protein
MRRLISSVLVFVMCVGTFASGAFAATTKGQQGGSINGVAQGADKAPLRNYTVRVRNVSNGQLAGSTTSTAAGEFSFSGLQPGNYIVEIVDAAGKVVGMSPSVAVGAGVAVTVSVSATAAGALATSSGAGFSLFGLGKLASVAVLGAAGATAVAAVVATREDASPSR